MADGAADDAAQHIAAPFVAGNDAVGNEKRAGADVIGNHLQAGHVHAEGHAHFARGGADERLKQINLVIAVHALQDGGQALQPHASIHAGRGQAGDAAVFMHFKLHEHVVPDFNEAVAVFIRAAGRAAGHVRTVVVKDFAARAAGASVGHHPEVVALVFAALVVADANHALGRQADDFRPDVIRLVVFVIDGGQQALGRQLVNLREQLPAPLQAFFLEIVAKAPVAQHLEKSVVARGVAHVFQVVVLAARAQAGLHAGGAVVGALVGAQKHILELHHTAVGEHERGVVGRHQRRRRHDGVPARGEKVEKSLANLRHGHVGD